MPVRQSDNGDETTVVSGTTTAPTWPPPPPPPLTTTRDDIPAVPAAPPPTPAPTPDSVKAPRPRASLLATLALILAVGGMMLVLSGPLIAYGIGVAGLGLLLSLIGLRATRKSHVAGKTDALIGLLIAGGAIALGVLALRGDLPWLGTDVTTANNLREWLDTQFADRF